MAKAVEIGSRIFRTQSSALEHYKAVLHRYQDGQRVSDQGDHADLVALIEAGDAVGFSTALRRHLHRAHASGETDAR